MICRTSWTRIWRKVDEVTAELTATAQDQVKREAEKLEQQVEQALVQLREEAAKLVAGEADRLDKQIMQQIDQLKEQSRDLVTSEAATLKEQVEKEIGQLNARYVEQSQALKSTVDQEIAKLPGLISQQVDKSLQQREAKKAPSDAPAKPNPEPKQKVGVNPPSALPGREVELAGTTGEEAAR